ncbi:MAG: hypothetical protein A2231_07750 [Candidatus Firestonebacteria bacterium RIFOXYA2_FULL_40_8]|nr:MAG: hypothetical protein A2231_07750 [Candidatus Firestonebacteria bacterium RIFOXYA2_FULL_40_8]
MKSKYFKLCMFLVFFPVFCFSSGLNGVEKKAGGYDSYIDFKGLKRTFRVHIPKDFDINKRTPFVFVLHGGGGNGKNMDEKGLSGSFTRMADKENFIVIYPDAYDKNWNDGRGVEDYKAQKDNIDDVGFFINLIDLFGKEFNIDKKRIYSTGISNGAIMSNRLACEAPGVFAAIAPVVGSIPKNIYLKKLSVPPTSVLIINSTNDPFVPWDGGFIHTGKRKLGEVVSVKDTFNFWVSVNACTKKEVISIQHRNKKDKTSVIEEISSEGKNGTEVVFYTIEGGGHTWPGSPELLPRIIVGKTNMDIDATQVIWEFFKKHENRNIQSQ